VAQKLQIIDQRTRKPGLFGKIYLSLDSSEPFQQFVKGERELSLEDLLKLSLAEKVFFMWMIFSEDFPFTPSVLKFALQRGSFRRVEAMNTIMEEIYPIVLNEVPEEIKERINQRIVEAQSWKEKRLTTKKSEWIKTREYNLYYHTVVPRVEFLTDLGLIQKIGRGRYKVREDVLPNSNIILRMCDEKNRKKMEEEIFNKMPRVVGEASALRKASESEIREEILRAHSRLKEFGNPRLDLLLRLTALLLLEKGRHATISEIRATFEKLSILFYDKIFITIEGNDVYVPQMNLE
jgi:hypothetical protein